jgi:hypothetical protein
LLLSCCYVLAKLFNIWWLTGIYSSKIVFISDAHPKRLLSSTSSYFSSSPLSNCNAQAILSFIILLTHELYQCKSIRHFFDSTQISFLVNSSRLWVHLVLYMGPMGPYPNCLINHLYFCIIKCLARQPPTTATILYYFLYY